MTFAILFFSSMALFPVSTPLIAIFEPWLTTSNPSWTGISWSGKQFFGFTLIFTLLWTLPCVLFAGLLLKQLVERPFTLRLKPILLQAFLAGMIAAYLPQAIILFLMGEHPWPDSSGGSSSWFGPQSPA